MASSDDEDERLPTEVSEYYFEDGSGVPVSFAVLALKLDDDDESKSLDDKVEEIGLRGKIDNGLQQFFAQVVAWKYDITPPAKPEVMVLTKKGGWIKLLKPKKSYQEIIRSILITVHCLHYVKGHPETSEKALWENMAKVFRLLEPQPSANDLVSHLDLVDGAVERIKELKGSKALTLIIENKQTGKIVSAKESGNATMSGFIVDEVHDDEDEIDEGELDEDNEDAFESVCALCDNGGKIFSCEGKCLRSFHFTEEAGEDSNCDSLGYTEEEAEIIEKENHTFVCKNCELNIHMCFICGKLGSSDKSSGAEVFQCVAGTCGYYYHPNCVVKALHFKRGDKTTEADIAAGKPFMCPIHFCAVCCGLEPEDISDESMQFAVCRRCPKAYHRKCLPGSISFEEDEEKGIEQRAWTGLLVNKILIYCLTHVMDEELGTPARDHVKFPGSADPVKEKRGLNLVTKENAVSKKREIVLKDAARAKIASRAFEKSSSALKKSDSAKRNEGSSSAAERPKKRKLALSSRLAVMQTLPRKLSKRSDDEGSASLGDQQSADTKEPTSNGSIIVKDFNKPVRLKEASKKRALSFLTGAESLITLKDISDQLDTPSTHTALSEGMLQYFQDMTMGKIETSVEAIRAAAQLLKEGGSLEDAKGVCKPRLLKQITSYKNRLKVYLAPFLHGSRYTSFGRHFTQVEKLQEIVNKLCWYVEDGDMVVDFCCGANDFSCLMKEKMDEMGKSCNFKNYDLYPTPNDFNFEQKDWMTVNTGDLPEGKQLIMGLNPPFGTGAFLANKFIDKALEFKPKLLILIVPRETVRVDDKNPYDLIWEDDKLLSGKAFYLPGSLDANDRPLEDWNKHPPPLSLWSRRDCTFKHMEIARRLGHIPGAPQIEESLPKSELSHSHEEPHELSFTSDLPDVRQQEVKVEREKKGKESPFHAENPFPERGPSRSPANDWHDDESRRKRGKKGAGAYPRKDHASPNYPRKDRASPNYPRNDRASPNYPRKDRASPGYPRKDHVSPTPNYRRNDDHLHPEHRWHPMDYPGPDFRARSPPDHFEYPMNPALEREAEMRHQMHIFGRPPPLPPLRFPPSYALGGGPVDPGYDSMMQRYAPRLGGESNTFGGGQTDPGFDSILQRYAPRLDESNAFGRGQMDPGFDSILQRYAPRLDESNAFPGAMQRHAPRLDESNAFPGPMQRHPDDRIGMHYPPPPSPPGVGRGGHLQDFARAPYPPPPNSSSGWLNE